jgi:hypothetical protein
MLYQGIFGGGGTLKIRHTIRHRYQDVPTVGFGLEADCFLLYNLMYLSVISLVIFIVKLLAYFLSF